MLQRSTPGPEMWRITATTEEILDTCRKLRQLTGREVTLVTGDTSMRLRGQARGISVVRMPDDYLRSRPAEEAEQAAEERPGA